MQLWDGGGRVPTPALERVLKIVAGAAGPDHGEKLSADTVLVGGGLGLDSVAVLGLLVALETEFGIEIPADALEKTEALKTIGSLSRFIESRIPPAK